MVEAIEEAQELPADPARGGHGAWQEGVGSAIPVGVPVPVDFGWCVVLLKRHSSIVDFVSKGRLHATAFRPSARVANPTPRQNEPQGEAPDP